MCVRTLGVMVIGFVLGFFPRAGALTLKDTVIENETKCFMRRTIPLFVFRFQEAINSFYVSVMISLETKSHCTHWQLMT